MTPQAVVLPPPTERYTLLGWLRRNLFSTWYNALLTFAAAGLIVAAARPLLAWAFTQAEWAVVAANLQLFMVGQYPRDELWRVWLCLGLAAALVGLTWGVWVRGRRGLGVLLAVLPFALALLPIGGQSRLALGGAGLAGLLSYALGRWGPPGLRRIAVIPHQVENGPIGPAHHAANACGLTAPYSRQCSSHRIGGDLDAAVQRVDRALELPRSERGVLNCRVGLVDEGVRRLLWGIEKRQIARDVQRGKGDTLGRIAVEQWRERRAALMNIKE